MPTYGAEAAKSQNERAPWRESSSEIAFVSEMIPVTFEAAENDPIFIGRSPYSTSRACSSVRLILAVKIPVILYDVGDGLPPGQLVGMMLVWTDEDHWPLVWRYLVDEVVGIVEGSGEPDLEAS